MQVTAKTELQLRFWGARGNLPPLTPSREFGNHTTCLQVQAAGFPPLLVDMGSGLSGAGALLVGQGVREFDVFLSHLHVDHLQGMFSFMPFYRRDCTVRIHAARPDLESALRMLFGPPYHPVALQALSCRLEMISLPAEGCRRFDRLGLTLGWCQVPHPQGCTAYRFDDGANAAVFATDVELGTAPAHPALERLLTQPRSAGLLVADGFFTDQEVDQYADWGHSSWEQCRDLQLRTGVAGLVITHHHPARTDADLRGLEAQAGGVHWARENETLILRGNRVLAT